MDLGAGWFQGRGRERDGDLLIRDFFHSENER